VGRHSSGGIATARSRDRRAIPVAGRPKASVCDHSLAGIRGSNPAGGMDVSVVCVVQ
jgi:hypothetical protein